jgi:hypothetical protein
MTLDEKYEYVEELLFSIQALPTRNIDEVWVQDVEEHSGTIFFENPFYDYQIYATPGWLFINEKAEELIQDDNILISVDTVNDEGETLSLEELPYVLTYDIDKDVNNYREIMRGYLKRK